MHTRLLARSALAVLAASVPFFVAMFVWAAADEPLRQSESHKGLLFLTSIYWVVAGPLAVRAWRRPGSGEVAAGVVLLLLGAAATATAAGALWNWGEIWPQDPNFVRTTWDPWDSLWVLPFTASLAAGALFLAAGVRTVRHAPRRPGGHVAATR